MNPTETISGIPEEVKAQLRQTLDDLLKGVRHPDKMKAACERILQLADSGLKRRPLRHLGLELFPREANLLSELVSLVKVILYGLIQGPVKIVDLGMTLVTLETNFLLALGQGGTKLLGVVQGRLQLLGQPLQLGQLPA